MAAGAVLAGLVLPASAGANVVCVSSGDLTVDGTPFKVRGVHYNVGYIGGGNQFDDTAAQYDVPKIKALGANTIGTFVLGKFMWQTTADNTTGPNFYDSLYPVAEANDLKIIVGYYSNESIDWTDASAVATVTAQYQELVNKAKVRPSTLMYNLGDEVVEHMTVSAQKTAYAKWIGDMVNWTHVNDPSHPVTYSEGYGSPALGLLKTYAPNLDVYSFNDYHETDTATLTADLNAVKAAWPCKPVLLHGWGTDSWDNAAGAESQSSQASRISTLANAIINVGTPILGSVFFEWNDEWRDNVHDHTNLGWDCRSCFEGVPNAEHWGLAAATSLGAASTRTTKAGYATLQSIWGGTPAPDTTPPDTIMTSAPSDGPADGAYFDYRSTEAGSTFKCQLDSTVGNPCPPPRWFPNQSVGTHTFKAWAIDSAGNIDPTPAVATWTRTP